MFGCSDSNLRKASGNLKEVFLEKMAKKLSLDTVPMKKITASEVSTFVEAVKKSIDVGSFYPINPFCDTNIIFFMITSEQTLSSQITREKAISMLDDMMSIFMIDSTALYKSNEPLEDGSAFYKLVMNVTYESEKIDVAIGFVLTDGKVNSIYLY